MNLTDDDFALFGLPRRFQQDRAVIDARWRELQSKVHPDRFAAEGGASQRVAMQWAVRVNEAYKRLKDPVQRAAYLCELNGTPIGMENNTAMPAEFLEQQMSWREALDEASEARDVERLAHEVRSRLNTTLLQVQTLIDDAHDMPAAASQVRALMFIERFASDVDERLDALGQ